MHEDIGRIKFGTALIVATTLKVLALLVLLGGVVLAIAGGTDLANTDTSTGGDVTTYAGAVIGSTLTSASLLGAAGFGLEVLVDSYTQLWSIRFGEDDD